MSTTTAELAGGPAAERRIEHPDAHRRGVDLLDQASPRRRSNAPARPPLEVVPPPRRSPRWGRLGRRTLGIGAALAAVGTLFGLVGVHVRLTTNEVHLSSLQARLDVGGQENVALRLRVAQLASPIRIVASAQQLGMVPPLTVTYLTAIADGPTVGGVAQAPAAPAGSTAGPRGGGG